MDMLLRKMTVVELAGMLERHRNCSSAGCLTDPAAKKRARRTAKLNGVWGRIEKDLDPARDIPVFKRSDFRRFQRTGNRTVHQDAESARSAQLDLAALALWLDHPKADLDYLQDLLWAYCDDWTWVMAAHEYAVNDLGSTMRGARLAEIVYALGGRIEQEVADRVHAEIERRIFRNVTDPANKEFWHTARMNWNHVCNGSVIRAALLEIKDSSVLARLIHPMIQNMTYALDGFTDDGGCEEGPGYWGFGFGHFVQVAHALHCRTGGELNIMADEKIERICRYPLAAHIDGVHRVTFADSGWGAVGALNALQINHFFSMPELYELCARRVEKKPLAVTLPDSRHLHKLNEGKFKGAGPLDVRDMHSLALFRGERATGRAEQKDYVLPNLGMVKMLGKSGVNQMTVAALAGNNGVPHNHNDIGSFLVFKCGRMVLTDPGAPLYNKQTFREGRYDILWCRSKGHSVPIINGREQKAGRQYIGELSVQGLNEPGIKRAVIDMSRAYPQGTVKALIRKLELDYGSNTLIIEDAYTFSQRPDSVDDAFVTFEKATAIRNGKAVRIGSARGGVTLSADQPGRFRIVALREKPEHTKPGTPALQRITFVPQRLSLQFVLRFSIR
jgi:hypothetical protein